MHLADRSALTLVLLKLCAASPREVAALLSPRITDQLAAHFYPMAQKLCPSGPFIENDWTDADGMPGFAAEVVMMQGMGNKPSKLAAFVASVHSRLAWLRQREKAERTLQREGQVSLALHSHPF